MVTFPKKISKNAQPLDSCGQTWWLSDLSPGIRKIYASMIRSRARQSLIDDKESLSNEAYAAEYEALQDRIDAGAYEWGPPVELGGIGAGKAIRAALNGTEGFVLLIQMLLIDNHEEMDLTKVTEIINGNPEAIAAAYRAAQGLPPLAEAPAGPEPGTTQQETSNPIEKTKAIRSEGEVSANAS